VCSVADVGRKELQEPDVGAVGGDGDLGGEHGSEWMGKRSEPVHGSASLDCRGSAETIVPPRWLQLPWAQNPRKRITEYMA
jgi:hypothetical protein